MVHTVSWPVTSLKSAMAPQVSSGAGCDRGYSMSWATTTSALANAASVAASSPASQSKMWLSCLPARSSRITGAPGSSALVASTTGGSCSYSTLMSSSASRAEYLSSAMTNAISCPWNRTLSVASTACTSWDRVGIQASLRSSSVSPVMTALTLGWASAARVSIETILACASGLRRIAPCSMPGSWMSSVKLPWPRMKRASSLRLTGPYAVCPRRVTGSVIRRPPRSRRCRRACLLAQSTDRTMFSYPVQRQICPDSASRISSGDGSGLRSSSHRAVIIMPGVQKPHCSPWHSAKPCWIGSSPPPASPSPFMARPSTVRTLRPSAMAASTVHDFTGVSSSHTTQAPQFDVSQPQCDPVRPRSSRRKWISSSRASTSRE